MCTALWEECTNDASSCCEPAICHGDVNFASCLPQHNNCTEATTTSSPISAGYIICDEEETANGATLLEGTNNAPLNLFISLDGSNLNNRVVWENPFQTLAKAIQEAIESRVHEKGGHITLMGGRYMWEDDGGIVDGLIGPSAMNPVVIKADALAA
eukprot:12140565-Ditylum_brightwellii.AAC.1